MRAGVAERHDRPPRPWTKMRKSIRARRPEHAPETGTIRKTALPGVSARRTPGNHVERVPHEGCGAAPPAPSGKPPAPTVASAAHSDAFMTHPDSPDLCTQMRCQSRNFHYLCPREDTGIVPAKRFRRLSGAGCRRKLPHSDQTICDGPFWNLCEVASLLEFFNIRAVASFLRLLPGQKPCLNGRWKNGPAPHASPCAPPR